MCKGSHPLEVESTSQSYPGGAGGKETNFCPSYHDMISEQRGEVVWLARCQGKSHVALSLFHAVLCSTLKGSFEIFGGPGLVNSRVSQRVQLRSRQSRAIGVSTRA